MTPLFKKLNLGGVDTVHILNAPASFQAELDKYSEQLAKAAQGDAIVWMVYPKGSSKKYRCEFNRDSGWAVLGAAGFEPVRMVAVDEEDTRRRKVMRRVSMLEFFL